MLRQLILALPSPFPDLQMPSMAGEPVTEKPVCGFSRAIPWAYICTCSSQGILGLLAHY